MKPVHIGESACQKTLRYMDSYLANELLVETTHEVVRHLEGCTACSAELEIRSRVRTQLRDAARTLVAPPDLAVRIRERISEPRQRAWFAADWTRWAVGAAACLALAAVLSTTLLRERMPDIADRRGQNAYIERVVQSVAAVFHPGLTDHIHCAVFRRYPKNPPSDAQMEQDLGDYKGLLALVRRQIPERYRVVMGHQCSASGRRYVHFAFQDGQRVVSLVISRKNPGESLAALTPARRPGDVPIYRASTHNYETAAFETAQYLAFVVSDISEERNLQLAQSLAPAVYDFLARAGA